MTEVTRERRRDLELNDVPRIRTDVVDTLPAFSLMTGRGCGGWGLVPASGLGRPQWFGMNDCIGKLPRVRDQFSFGLADLRSIARQRLAVGSALRYDHSHPSVGIVRPAGPGQPGFGCRTGVPHRIGRAQVSARLRAEWHGGTSRARATLTKTRPSVRSSGFVSSESPSRERRGSSPPAFFLRTR
jgi:hypothetical protein